MSFESLPDGTYEMAMVGNDLTYEDDALVVHTDVFDQITAMDVSMLCRVCIRGGSVAGISDIGGRGIMARM